MGRRVGKLRIDVEQNDPGSHLRRQTDRHLQQKPGTIIEIQRDENFPDLEKGISSVARSHVLKCIGIRYKWQEVTKNDYETLAAFRYELRKFLRFSEQAALDAALAPQQYLALLAIEGFPGRNRITIGELSERLQIAAHSAAELVNRLETGGLVARRPSDEDRRCVYVELTTQGRKKLERLAAAHQAELQNVGPLLVGLLERVANDSESGK
jgi:DNA-binding MarR family transcriptional regulator